MQTAVLTANSFFHYAVLHVQLSTRCVLVIVSNCQRVWQFRKLPYHDRG